MDSLLADLKYTLKQSNSQDEVWRQTEAFITNNLGETNRHVISAIDVYEGKTVLHTNGYNNPPNLKKGETHSSAQIIWMLMDSSALTYPYINDTLPTSPINSMSPLVSTGLLYASARCRALREQMQAHKIGLTPRELETLQLLARGYRSDQIAHRMGIKRVTVNLHISNARRKLNATTREQALALAVHLGIVTP